MDVWIIALLILGSAAGAGIIYMSLRKTGAELAAMKARADQNGWTFSHAPGAFGKEATTTFASHHENWTMFYKLASVQGRSVIRELTWQSPIHGLTEGAIVLGSAVNQKTATAMPNRAVRVLNGYLMRRDDNFSDLGPNMKNVPGTDSGNRGIVLATPGQETRLDAVRNDTGLLEKRQVLPNLIIIRDGHGVTLRSRSADMSIDRITDLVRLGKAVRAALDDEP